MLPLWIIDLRAKSPQKDKPNRRDYFESLVGEIDHVYIKCANDSSRPKNDLEQSDAAPKDNNSASSIATFASETSNIVSQEKEDIGNDESLSNSTPTLAEQFESLDKQEADKNSLIVGNYWTYSPMERFASDIHIEQNWSDAQSATDSSEASSDLSKGTETEGVNDEEKSPAQITAEKLYEFQSELVAEGQEFIKRLRKSNARPHMKINIVVLGDLTEDFTRIVFPAIAGILQKEKGRILPHHIHQGMEVIGMLFIPSDINTREVSVRRSMQRTLREIDVQYHVNDMRGYDHMMLYQDVQNRTECSYPILSDKQVAEYLVQCLAHLYLACDETHPLLSGTSSADTFYFSMGASSVFYDTEKEDLKGRHKLAVEFIRNFKSKGVDEKENQDLHIISDNDYNPDIFFDFDAFSRLDCDDIDEGTPNLHPIHDFLAKFLKRYYYNLYLKFFTQNLMQKIINQIDNCTRSSLEEISTKSKRRLPDAEKKIFSSIEDIIGRISANDGGVPTIIRLFKEMQDSLSQKRADIQRVLEQKFWLNIETKFVSKNKIDKFVEYHSAYQKDIASKNGGTAQNEMKAQAVNELNGQLSQESTTLSRICRSVLLGVVFALAFVPVLNMMSPYIIDLGHVKRNSEWWSLGLFFIPALLQVVSYWRYNRKKRRAINSLEAMYLHDAYARVANRIESEINSFYDKMIALSNRYIERCENIQSDLGKDYKDDDECKPLIPQSLFNQPLIGGSFGGENLLPESESDDAEVKINYIRYKLSDLTNVEYFLFLNQNKSILKGLFEDVAICENLIRRVKDNGEEELVTKDQQEKEQKEAWEKHKTEFHTALREELKKALLRREDSTVGEKLNHYCAANPDNAKVLKPMIEYAATNGEITSSADKEFTDAKINDKRIETYITPYISSACSQIQTDKYNKVYGKYVFITRWRSFDQFNLNRILPNEDFDEKARRQAIYAEEIKAKKNKGKIKNRSMEEEKVKKDHPDGQEYKPKISSLLLWALCPDDSSSEWFRLFDSEFFAEAYADKNTFRKVLNQND